MKSFDEDDIYNFDVIEADTNDPDIDLDIYGLERKKKREEPKFEVSLASQPKKQKIQHENSHNYTIFRPSNSIVNPKKDEEIKSTKSMYYIQSDNIGYKLLQRSGWKGEGGLGKSGQGMNYPISVETPRGPPVLGTKNYEHVRKARRGPISFVQRETLAYNQFGDLITPSATAARPFAIDDNSVHSMGAYNQEDDGLSDIHDNMSFKNHEESVSADDPNEENLYFYSDNPNEVYKEEKIIEEEDPELAALNALLNHQKRSVDLLISQKDSEATMIKDIFESYEALQQGVGEIEKEEVPNEKWNRNTSQSNYPDTKSSNDENKHTYLFYIDKKIGDHDYDEPVNQPIYSSAAGETDLDVLQEIIRENNIANDNDSHNYDQNYHNTHLENSTNLSSYSNNFNSNNFNSNNFNSNFNSNNNTHQGNNYNFTQTPQINYEQMNIYRNNTYPNTYFKSDINNINNNNDAYGNNYNNLNGTINQQADPSLISAILQNDFLKDMLKKVNATNENQRL